MMYVDDVAPAITVHPAVAVHRYQAYEYVIGVVPLQLPVCAVSVEPTTVWPEIVGALVLSGGVGAAGAATALVRAEKAVADPNLFVAVTRTRIAKPRSAEPSTYDEPV